MRRVKSSFLLLAFGTVLACSQYTSPSQAPDPIGAYHATLFTIVTDGDTLDELNEGVTIDLVLGADGSTMGTLLVPAATPNPLDLAGTWTRNGSVVTFRHPTQTFLDLLPFTLVGDELVADGHVGPGEFKVTLSRETGAGRDALPLE